MPGYDSLGGGAGLQTCAYVLAYRARIYCRNDLQ
jgi:hypothetical protein